jgi:Protein of unknown function (DUF3551)
MRLPRMRLPMQSNRLIAATFVAAFVAVAGSLAGTSTAAADPYRWCAIYSGNSGGATNCGFVTLEQCQATVSGIGGFCNVNLFYDGVPFGEGGAWVGRHRVRR